MKAYVSKSKKIFVVVVWLFLIFRFSFSCFNVFLVSCYIKQFLGGLYLFCEDFPFFAFKESTLHCLKKFQAQIIAFNEKAVAKISSISSLNSPP